MFIAYTDASIKKGKVFLGFRIEFEDGSLLHRRIVSSKTDIDNAEAHALLELTQFLEYYGLDKGTILFDSGNVEYGFKNKKGKLYKAVLYQVDHSLEKLKVRTQLIPRKLNKAHRICNEKQFRASSIISAVSRDRYSSLGGFPDYYLSISAYNSYKELKKKRISFAGAYRKLNEKIFVGELEFDLDDNKIYAFYDIRIKVFQDTIVSISKVNFVVRKHHWRAMKKKRKLRKHLQQRTSLSI
ncbi:hypothetical protein ABEV54_05805 [Peribacillus psychrosaccharolyticus]|uniref:hypothetical protein n=1 Tax=Peribacillus psychrosaccharolyticus TaxID=1407 RepID=UPI003D2DEA60